MAQMSFNSVLDNYHHLGDAASLTDGLHYDPSLGAYEKSDDGRRSGVKDDMWAFTTRNPGLDFRAATMFAAASRALAGYNDDLAQRALTQSKRLLQEAAEQLAHPRGGTHQGGERDSLMPMGSANMAAHLQLYAATGEKAYLRQFEQQIWKSIGF